ncbi:MAG: hypothetical protein J6V55_05240 [Alistipes sp.]|nr:hypothetical protein [Alistipes sp.]
MKRGILVSLYTLLIALLGFSACERGGEEVKQSNIKLYVEELVAKSEGEQMRFTYTIVSPVEGVKLDVKCDAEWVSNIGVYPSFVDLTVAKNDTGVKRSAVLKCSYGKESVELNLVQEVWCEPLSIKVNSVEATAVVFSVDAHSEDTTWIGQVVGKEWFESYSQDGIIGEDLKYYVSCAEEEGISLEEYLSKMLSRGSHANIRISGLDTETEYVVYIYGMNTAGEVTTTIYSEAFTTTAPYQGNDVTYDFDINVNRAIADITITPSHEGVAYFNNLITREDFELYGGDIEKAADAVIAKVIDDYLAWDYTLAEVFEYNTDYVATNYQFEAMANTEYVAFAFKWNEKCERVSEVSYEWFSVGTIPPSKNVLEMTISDVTQSTFYVNIKTTNNDPYAIFAIPSAEIAKMRDDAKIFDYILEEYGTSFLYNYIFNGDIEGEFSGMEAGTEYAVLLFGYEAGVLTTKITREDITTLQAGSVDACQYDIVVSDIDDREAYVTITPSDYSVWYYWNVFEADATEEEVKAYIENSYNSYYYSDYWEFSYYELAQGKVSSRLSQLMPNTDYKIVIIPMHPEIFAYTGSMREGGEFTTNEAIIADITITAGFDAYYDGDEVSALEPTYLSNYQGCVILPITVNIEGDFSGYLYTIFTYMDGLEDPAIYSDDLLIDNLYSVGATWSPAYFRGVWDVEMMIAAVAFDHEGNPSPVYRHRFICTREGAGDAQEFVDYYLGNITTSATRSLSQSNNALGVESLVVTNDAKADKMPVERSKSISFTR